MFELLVVNLVLINFIVIKSNVKRPTRLRPGFAKNIVIISLQSLRPLREELLSRSNYRQGLESVAEKSNSLNLFQYMITYIEIMSRMK